MDTPLYKVSGVGFQVSGERGTRPKTFSEKPGKIAIPKHQLFKFQNTSIKLQINLKFEVPMNKLVKSQISNYK
jgi:hypothetical protein